DVVGRLQPVLGLTAIATDGGDEAGVVVAEDVVGILALEPLDRVERAAQVARADPGPGRQQGRRQVRRAAAAAAAQIFARRDIAPRLHRLDAEGEAGEAVVGIALQQLARGREGLL